MGMGLANGDALIQSAKKGTFGGTISCMRRVSLLEREVQLKFEHIRDERNWLVHRSLRDRQHAMQEYGQLLRLMGRLDKIRLDVRYLMKYLEDETESYVISSGVHPSEISSEVEGVLESWSDPD